MDAIDALHTRTSVPKLTDPAPSGECLDNICRAALRAADHGVLRPWRFLLIAGEARLRLGELFVKAALHENSQLDPAAQERLRDKPLRAPLIIVSISRHQQTAKVPVIEQDLSAAAASQNMLLAAHAQDIGAFWRTGAMAYDPIVKRGLGLADNEHIIGFLYLGRKAGPSRRLADPDIAEFFRNWP
ncbi:MAG: nitroreductase [Gammaproteobacteria bacterium]|nr:nitroreductase [Pseudomonadales bacterium]MCP5346466.1 nitroreductase [Pseudomonadales bacterium]